MASQAKTPSKAKAKDQPKEVQENQSAKEKFYDDGTRTFFWWEIFHVMHIMCWFIF